MRRTLATVTLVSALTLAPAATATAFADQAAGPVLAQTEVEETVTDDGGDDYGDWGLMGLLGLFGLFGYKKYKEHRAARTSSATSSGTATSTSRRTATTDDDGTPRRT